MIRCILFCCLVFGFQDITAQQRKTPNAKVSKPLTKWNSSDILLITKKSIKFNRQSSAIHFLQESDPLYFYVWDSRDRSTSTRDFVRNAFPYLRNTFSKKVQFIDDELGKAYLKVRANPFKPVKGERIVGSGTFVSNDRHNGIITTFYDIYAEFVDTSWAIKGTFVCFQSDGISNIPQLIQYSHIDEYGQENFLHPLSTAKGSTEFDLIADVVHFMRFADASDLKGAMIPAGAFVKCENKYYLNETKSNIQILGLWPPKL